MLNSNNLIVRHLGLQDYERTWQAMQTFTAQRNQVSTDEIWLVEHPPVYTLGLNAKTRPVCTNEIPVVQTDRGGDITYHGPGQAVLYALLDLRRLGIGVKTLVHGLEQSVIDLLAAHQVRGERRAGAPGVYIANHKIAALGLRVKQGCSYHGLSFNVAMDLAPFADIHPCGYQGLQVTQLRDLGLNFDIDHAGRELVRHLARVIGYNRITSSQEPA